MKSLVTGGAGFIGSHLAARLLASGHDVVVLDSFRRGNKLAKTTLAAVELVQGDVRDEATVLRAAHGCDLIFHFAAVLGVDAVAIDPLDTMDTEAISLRHVAKAAAANGGVKVVYASTSGVYGRAAVDQAVEEDSVIAPKSCYAAAKRYGEFYLEALYRERGLPSVALRFFNAYGPRQDSRMVIPRFFGQAMRGEPLTVFGDGQQTRDFTYIDDVSDVVVALALQSTGCEIYNVANRQERTVNDLAHCIVDLTGSTSPVIHAAMPPQRHEAEVARRFGSPAKAFALTGIKPRTPLETGLGRVYESFLADGMPELEPPAKPLARVQSPGPAAAGRAGRAVHA